MWMNCRRLRWDISRFDCFIRVVDYTYVVGSDLVELKKDIINIQSEAEGTDSHPTLACFVTVDETV